MNRPCWICSGRGNSLCVRCNRARIERMAKYNIDSDTAVYELRQMRIDDDQATAEAAAELEPQSEIVWGTERAL